jgi:hypothetical protein
MLIDGKPAEGPRHRYKTKESWERCGFEIIDGAEPLWFAGEVPLYSNSQVRIKRSGKSKDSPGGA